MSEVSHIRECLQSDLIQMVSLSFFSLLYIRASFLNVQCLSGFIVCVVCVLESHNRDELIVFSTVMIVTELQNRIISAI